MYNKPSGWQCALTAVDYAGGMPSSIKPVRQSGLRIRVTPEEVTLVVWPLAQRPLGSLVAVGSAALASWLVAQASGAWWAGAAVAVGLAITLWRTWLPVRYTLASGGIVQSILGTRRRIPWSAIRLFEVRRSGALLLPDMQVTPLSPLRGLFLPWCGQQALLLANLDYYLGTWNGSAHETVRQRTKT